MKYYYFVYYKAKRDNNVVEGSGELQRDKKIKTVNDIKSIETAISLQTNVEEAVLCNFILMRRSIK